MKVYPDAIFYRVCRKPIFVKGIKNGLVLALDKELHGSYQAQKIEWKEYAPQYIVDIAMSEKAQMLTSKIWKQVKESDVFLVCVCGREIGKKCHRFLLKGLIEVSAPDSY